jgi:hypothetical protein
MTIFIKNWGQHYEKAETRKLKEMKWIAIPTDTSDKIYRRITRLANGAEVFGIWLSILEIASKMPERGVLKDKDGDLSYQDLEDIGGFPADKYESSIKILCSDHIGWLGVDNVENYKKNNNLPLSPDNLPQHPEDLPTSPDYITLQDNTEQDKTKQDKKQKEVFFELFWDAYPARNGKKAGKQEAKDKFFTLKESDYLEIIQNAKNYGINNEYPKDPARFLKNNFWKDWSTPMVVQETRKFETAMERTNRILQEEQEKTERLKHASKLREFRPRQSFDIQESDFKTFPESEPPDLGQFFRAEN